MAIFRGPGGAGNATTDSEITLLTQLEQSASTSAANAATSEANAASSASSASTSATNAANSASSASTSATNAAGSASAAASSATSAASSATAAGTSATNAANSATAASTSATNAASSATAAAGSASSASTSATNAANSASAAATSETNAAASASSASSSASSASTSATNAANSASTASTAATNASNSASAAAASATSASGSASSASTSATNAAASATAALASENNAASSASSASSSASSASSSATSASNSASSASTSATNAANSASDALDSKVAAANSAANASISASSAATSESNAAASAAAAASALDNFDDRYLGVKTADPTLDNDGNALISGALYFNDGSVTPADKGMRVYDGAQWIPASASQEAALITYEYVATAGQTTFSGNDVNAVSLSYIAGGLIVSLNGVVLRPGDDYTATNGTSIVLTTAAAAGDILQAHSFASFVVANTYTQAQIDAGFLTKNNPSYTGTLTGGTGVVNLGSGQFYKDASGNVGIGTATPQNAVVISDSSSNGFEFVTGGTAILSLFNRNTSSYIPLRVDASEVKLSIGGTIGAQLVSGGNFQFNSGYGSVATAFGCRAWVNFNGTTSAIRASGNVSSITSRGTGAWTVNLTTAMPDANYGFSGIAGSPAANSAAYVHLANGIAPTTTALAVDVITDGGTRQNATHIGISIFR